MSVPVSERTAWIPLMDYAMKKGISLSTLRRHIKSNKIAHRIENGRYLLLDDDATAAPNEMSPRVATPIAYQGGELVRLRLELQKAREEIAELKTLIALYEETLPQPRLDV